MIPFVRLDAAEPGRVDTVAPLIRRVIAPNPGPFTYTGTGTYIVGSDKPGATAAVIDPGPLDDSHLTALLVATAGQTVSHILITHSHRDHVPLARPLAERTGATVLAARPPRHLTHASATPDEDSDADFVPDRIISDGEVVSGDGWTLRTVATPGHTSDHLCFLLEQTDALFCGDHVMGWSTTVVAPPDGDMAAYMASLERVIALAPRTLWPTHGAPVTDPLPYLRAYRAHRLEREAQIVSRLEAGDRTIAEIVPVLYAAVDRRLWPAASLSVWAHLIGLVGNGRVVATPQALREAEYRLV